VLFDKRGHGLSELGSSPHRIETHASDLVALLDYLEVGSAIICGLSIGGLIAQAVYGMRPELVKALILCDTAARIGTATSWNQRIAAIRENGIASIAAGVLETWFTPEFRKTRGAELAGYRTMLERQSVEGYSAACAALRDADYRPATANIAVPSLVVVGDQDGSTQPDLVRVFAHSITGARLEIIADAGHIPCIEQPGALASLVRDFTLNVG
jgi:3-oxoadipate enol-lactonase